MSTKVDEIAGRAAVEASAVIALTKLADGPVAVSERIVTDDGREFFARRIDFALDNVTPLNKAKIYPPQFVKQTVRLTDALSMEAYLNRFRNPSTLMFASIKDSAIVGIVDYHGEATDQHPIVKPDFGTHIAVMALAFSQEWLMWTGSNTKMMEHVEFASFLEENCLDVVEPVGAELLELCRDLQVRQDVHFASSVRLGDKVSVEFSKDENATTKSNMELPIEFTISIPVYFNEPPVAVRCLMRRKIDHGELRLGYKMVRLENIRQADFQRIVGAIEGGTTVPAVFGTPA